MLRVEGELNVGSYAKYAAAEEDTGLALGPDNG